MQNFLIRHPVPEVQFIKIHKQVPFPVKAFAIHTAEIVGIAADGIEFFTKIACLLVSSPEFRKIVKGPSADITTPLVPHSVHQPSDTFQQSPDFSAKEP